MDKNLEALLNFLCDREGIPDQVIQGYSLESPEFIGAVVAYQDKRRDFLISQEVGAIEHEYSMLTEFKPPCFSCRHAKITNGGHMSVAGHIRETRFNLLQIVARHPSIVAGPASDVISAESYSDIHEQSGKQFRLEVKSRYEALLSELAVLRSQISVTCLLDLAKNELPTSCSSWAWSGIAGLD